MTGVPSGQYVLLHWANVLGKIVETDYSNNASSTRFSLRWRRDREGVPRVKILRRCPGSVACPRS